MEIRAVHHAGHTVADMERSLAFYRDILGLKVVDDAVLGGPDISAMVGLEDASLRAVFLSVDGRPPFVELIQYFRPTGRQLHGGESVADVGNAHFSFLVSDIHATIAELKDKGVQFAGPPLLADEGPFDGEWAAYCYDPDGMVVEWWGAMNDRVSEKPPDVTTGAG
jgi:catechol 2,3-dioxygenase-like lactoylglutathione lyase family enzyme